MRHFGLIGFPLSHSFSKKYFTEKFDRERIKDCNYENFPLRDIGLLPGLLSDNENLVGLNVTIPYKRSVMSYLDELDKDVSCIGAVNTIKIERQGKKIHTKGFNTDVYGFSTSIKPFLKPHHHHALILGTGGASKAVAHALKGMGFTLSVVSRTPKQADQISYNQITNEMMIKSKVIVNTSPLGMHPDIDSFPDIPYQYLTPEHILYDLVYNPGETKFMSTGRKMGATVINGLEMLHLQAEKAWEIWNTDC
jgi:shikimate dehydrogenase